MSTMIEQFAESLILHIENTPALRSRWNSIVDGLNSTTWARSLTGDRATIRAKLREAFLPLAKAAATDFMKTMRKHGNVAGYRAKSVHNEVAADLAHSFSASDRGEGNRPSATKRAPFMKHGRVCRG